MLRWSRSKTPDKPAQGEEKGARQKDGNARRINPGVVDILANVQKRPEKERASAEILNNLGSLIRNRWQALAMGIIGESVKVRLSKAESFG